MNSMVIYALSQLICSFMLINNVCIVKLSQHNANPTSVQSGAYWESLARLCVCAGSFQPSLFVDARSITVSYAAQSEGPTTIFLPVSFNIWFVCSKEPSLGDFEYPLWLRNKKNNLSGWIGISGCAEKLSLFSGRHAVCIGLVTVKASR